MRKYHQIGMHVNGYEENPYNRVRFDSDCPVPELVKTMPHVALFNKGVGREKSIIESNSSSEGLKLLLLSTTGRRLNF